MADALPPRYAIESDDEDEYNPLTTQRADQVPIVKIKIEGHFTTGCPLVIASGPAGNFWADGADLGEQQGAIFVNNIQVSTCSRLFNERTRITCYRWDFFLNPHQPVRLYWCPRLLRRCRYGP